MKERVCYSLPGDIEGEGIMKKVTNGNIGAEGGPKIWHFCGDIIFEWPLRRAIASIKS